MRSDPFAFSSTFGVLHVIYRDDNDAITHRWWDGSWRSESIAGPIRGRPTAIANPGETWDLFVRGGDDQLYYRSQNFGWSPWIGLSGTMASDPSVIGSLGGREDVFYLDKSGGLSHHFRTDGTSGWHFESLSRPSGTTLVGTPAVASTGRNQLDVFVRGSNNQLYHLSSDESGLFSVTNWASRPISESLSSDPSVAATGNNRIDIVYVTTSSHLGSTSMQNGKWSAADTGGSNYASSTPFLLPWAINRADAFAQHLDGSLEHKTTEVLCAVVYDSAAPGTQPVRSFCGQGRGGQACTSLKPDGSEIFCQDASRDYLSHPAPVSTPPLLGPWYQGAIDWAKAGGHSYVKLDPGQLGLVGSGPRTAGWPFLNDPPFGAALVVPSGINLSGSQDVQNWPTVLRPFVAHGAAFGTIIQLVDWGTDNLGSRVLQTADAVGNASVSYLTLNGYSSSLGKECPSRAAGVITPADIPTNIPLSEPNVGGEFQGAATGIWVGRTNPQAPIQIQQITALHLNNGLVLGINGAAKEPWCTFNEDECVSFGTGASTHLSGQCPVAATDPSRTCDPQHFLTPVPQEGCNCKHHSCEAEFFYTQGSSTNHVSVGNNSMCDVNVGISMAGGYADIAQNIILGGPTRLIGIVADSHRPDTSNITVENNYISDFEMGVETDGSVYLEIGDRAFDKITGGLLEILDDRGNPTLGSDGLLMLRPAKEVCSPPNNPNNVNNWLAIRQRVWDYAQHYYFSSGDEFYSFGESLSVHHNVINSTTTGISLYRQRGPMVFSNRISNSRASTDPSVVQQGIGVSNTAQGWVYDNNFVNIDGSDIVVAGTPGVNSLYGAFDNVFGGFVTGNGACYSMPNFFDKQSPPTGSSQTNCQIEYKPGFMDATRANSPCGINSVVPQDGGCGSF